MTNRTLAYATVALVVLLSGCGQGAPPSSQPDDTPEVQATDVPPAPVDPPAATVYSPDAASAPGGYCSLDAIDGGAPSDVSVRTGSQVTFAGWFADSDLTVIPQTLLLLRGSSDVYAIQLSSGGPRPDVAEALASDTLALAGFGVNARVDVQPGSYGLSVLVDQAGGRECDLKAQLQVIE